MTTRSVRGVPPGGSESEVAFETLLSIARRETLALVVAAQGQEKEAALIAAARLRWAISHAQQCAMRSMVGLLRASARLAAVVQIADRWLPVDPDTMADPSRLPGLLARLQDPSARLEPIDASNVLLVGLDLDDLPLAQLSVRGATIAAIRAGRARLDELQARSARIVNSQFEAASLCRSSFEDAVLEDCNLSWSNLERTSWAAAKVSRCDLTGAVMLDARLDGSRFVDCKFHGADLQSRSLLTPTAKVSAQFIRCDLRGTNWHARDLARASFLDCKLYGVHGECDLTGVVIERPDLSREGNGSQIVTRGDAVAHWTQDRGRAGRA